MVSIGGFVFALAIGLFIAFRAHIRLRERFIDRYVFPVAVSRKVLAKYPHLNSSDMRKVMRGLREYFHISNRAGRRMVSMPSQIVDVAWHEFILFTRDYHHFCQKAFGRFLHHTPAEAMRSPTIAQEGIKRAWRLACARENINPKSPERLPLLFALDETLKIPDGFVYALNCQSNRSSDSFCASHIGCSSCAGSGGDADGCGGCGGD